MATNKSIQMSGMTQIKRKLLNAGFTLIPLRHLMNEHSEIIVEEAKRVAPVDTGALQKSIRAKKVAMRGRLPTSIKVEATAPHSAFVHGNFKRLPNSYRLPPKKNRKGWGGANWRTKPHYPPLQPIKDWASRKGDINPYSVVNSINERGTPLVPFLLIAEKNTRKDRRKITKRVSAEISLAWKLKK